MTRSIFAGYNPLATTLTSVEATVTLPSFTCPKKYEGVGAIVSDFDPTDDNVSGVEADMNCSKKKVASYSAIFVVDGVVSYPTVTINAGDTVVMSISCSSTTGSTVSIDDEITASSTDASSSTPNDCTGADIGDGGFLKGNSSAQAPLPTFSPIDYSSATVNGDPLGSFDPQASNYYAGKKNVIDTGSLTDSGTAFTTTQGS
jgi:hypothetical protein